MKAHAHHKQKRSGLLKTGQDKQSQSLVTRDQAAGLSSALPATDGKSLNFLSLLPVLPAGPLIQAKLAVNTSGDKFEREADSMAGRIMQMKDNTSKTTNEGHKTEAKSSVGSCSH